MDHLAYDKVESDIVSVTFREGMTQRQIGELLEENKVCTADEFYQALDEGDYSHLRLCRFGAGRRIAAL